MAQWWSSLTSLNQVFYCVAAFFGVIFVWQLVAVLMGLAGDEGDVDHDVDVDHPDVMDHDGTYEDFEHGAQTDAAETVASFRVLTLRSVITFFTLFSWGGALYLNNRLPVGKSMGYAVLWGLGGMFAIAMLLHWMRQMTETGTKDIHSSVGAVGSVYLDIPADKLGEVRVPVSGVISYVKARSPEGKEIKAGSRVRVTRVLDQTTVEVEPIVDDA